jgi:hypothetical protein
MMTARPRLNVVLVCALRLRLKSMNNCCFKHSGSKTVMVIISGSRCRYLAALIFVEVVGLMCRWACTMSYYAHERAPVARIAASVFVLMLVSLSRRQTAIYAAPSVHHDQ